MPTATFSPSGASANEIKPTQDQNLFNYKPYDLKNTVSKRPVTGVWRLMTGYRNVYGGAMLSVCVAAISRTTTFLLLRYLVDNILGAGHTEGQTLFLAALGFVLLAFCEGSFTFLGGRLASFTAEKVVQRLRNYIYDHLQRLPFSYYDKIKTGEIVQRCSSDVDTIRRFLSEQLIGIGRIIIPFTINLTVLMTLDWKLGLLSVVMVPFIALASVFFFKKISKSYDEYQNQEAVVSTTLQENLAGVRVVKAFARQDYERNKFEKDNYEKFVRGFRLERLHAFYWPTADTLSWIQLLAGLSIAATMTIQGQITLGTYLAYFGILGQLVWPIRNLGRLIVQMSTGLVSFTRIKDIIEQDEEPLNDGTYAPAGPVRGEIEFRQVNFGYDTEKIILHDISFHCKAGQTVALLGSTGSGKTSMLNLLPRFYSYTSGSILLDGVELNTYSRSFLRTQISGVEQEPFLFSRTIRDNISYGVGRDVTTADIEAAARAAAIHDVILSFPKGYDTLVGEKGVTLSGGQKQRIALARTLLKNPRILILDDATSSVDTETEGEIRNALTRLMKDRTTFLIAHRIQSVMIADLILVMDKGRIVQQGTHDELVNQDGIYRQIYDLQSRIEVELEKEISSVSL